MTKEEVIEFIKDNLSIEISTKTKSGFYNERYQYVSVKLLLDDDVISESEDMIS